MPFHPFELEKFLSLYEQTVEYNFTESGVHPVTLSELLAFAGVDGDLLLDTSLNYPHVNGEPDLRERIASLYPGATAANVLVTVGASEANLLGCDHTASTGRRDRDHTADLPAIWRHCSQHGRDGAHGRSGRRGWLGAGP